jgi:hypothetical protein
MSYEHRLEVSASVARGDWEVWRNNYRDAEACRCWNCNNEIKNVECEHCGEFQAY